MSADSSSVDADAIQEAQEKRTARIHHAREEQELIVGMQMQDVLSVWGQPSSVDYAGDPVTGNQRWVYYEGLSSPWGLSSTRTVYFEKGQVAGWLTH